MEDRRALGAQGRPGHKNLHSRLEGHGGPSRREDALAAAVPLLRLLAIPKQGGRKQTEPSTAARETAALSLHHRCWASLKVELQEALALYCR